MCLKVRSVFVWPVCVACVVACVCVRVCCCVLLCV